MAVQRAFLLIADIGGYTRFMKVHRWNLAHAQDVIARLLESLIDAARSPLKLSKLEGDAAFFYAVLPGKGAPDLTAVARQIAAIRASFLDRQQAIEALRACTCAGCVQAPRLKLKFVAHLGEVAFQKVRRYSELAGVDVIVVHRMLKNDVPVPEYMLMSEAVLAHAGDWVRPHARPIEHDFEGIGRLQTYYVDLNEVARHFPPALASGRIAKLWESVKMNTRALPYVLGFKQPCAGFRNMSEAVGDARRLIEGGSGAAQAG